MVHIIRNAVDLPAQALQFPLETGAVSRTVLSRNLREDQHPAQTRLDLCRAILRSLHPEPGTYRCAVLRKNIAA